MARLEEFVTNPITALFVAVVFGALALSGRFNVTLTQAFLRIAWLVAVFGLRSQPYPLWIGGSAIVGGVLLILAFYFTPQAVFQNIGFLQSTKTTLFGNPIRCGGWCSLAQMDQQLVRALQTIGSTQVRHFFHI